MTEPGSVLREAEALITGDRHQDYGDAVQTHQAIADTFNGATGRDLTAHEVAVMMICVKLARIKNSPAKRDSWTDIAGYSDIGFRCTKDNQ